MTQETQDKRAVADNPAMQDIEDVLDYLEVGHRRYAIHEMARTRSLTYFMPLLREFFAGTEAKTRILFTMLHRLMVDDRVQWSRSELDDIFHWVRSGHRNYLLGRLSSVGWLEFYRDLGVYMVSDKGEALMRVLSRFALGAELENEGAALAEIEFSLLLELDDLPDRLQFLRNRLMKHAVRAETALESESAYRILEIYQQLKSAYRWAEQTRQTLEHIELSDDDDSEQWNAIRGVHDHLSNLHSLISRMQLVLQEIQRKQIDIARYGLTHLDFDNYLINANADLLADMMRRHLQKIPHPFFAIQNNMFAEAHEVLTRELPDNDNRRGWDTDSSEAEAGAAQELPPETRALAEELESLPGEWQGTSGLVAEHEWEVAAYRMQLMTLLADLDEFRREQRDLDLDPLIRVPVQAEFDPEGSLEAVNAPDGETYHLTRGRIRRGPETETDDD